MANCNSPPASLAQLVYHGCSLDWATLGLNPGWAGPSPSYHLILLCVDYDMKMVRYPKTVGFM